jgi:hypothetical protein
MMSGSGASTCTAEYGRAATSRLTKVTTATAARLVGAVEGLRPPGAMNIAPPNKASYQEATALATTALGSEKFESLRREGFLLSENEAIALALDGDRTLYHAAHYSTSRIGH